MQRPAPLPATPAALALLCCIVLLPACSMQESSETLVVPEVVRTNLYVSPNGNDSNPGSKAEPFKTLMRAAQAVAPGTTVHVAPGLYYGGIKTITNGTAEARIVFQSTERWGAKLVPRLDSQTSIAWDNRGSFVDIVGFDIDGSQYQGGIKWLSGFYNGGSHDAILHNHVHDIGLDSPCVPGEGAGIGVDSYNHGVQSHVFGNHVHDIGPMDCRFAYGISLNTSGSITDNIVYRIGGAAIRLWRDATHVVITNNTVSGASAGITVGGGDYFFTKGPNDHTVVLNNIVYDNKIGIMEHGVTGENNVFRNNLVFQNSQADWKLPQGRNHAGTVSAPPEFVAYTRNGTPDFRLSGKSPAIGKGTATYAQAVDFDGKPRTAARIDIGAVQH